jgi:hypothetical protein
MFLTAEKITCSLMNWAFTVLQLRDGGEGKTFVSWTYSVNPVFSQTEEQLTKFMTALYTNTLKRLETAANLRSKL